MILVTGAAGFIGSNFVKLLINKTSEPIAVVDNLTYASALGFKDIVNLPILLYRYNIIHYDALEPIFRENEITAIIHFAAESHVDNSIANCQPFIDTNITGTANLLKLAVKYKVKRFVHISTDEVFGVAKEGKFDENWHLDPQNPYSASKAAAEHFVKAFVNTYGLNAIIVNCSNNYGPNQFPEKLIPLTINNLIKGKKIPIYGNGQQIRDWLFVEDCCEAIYKVYESGVIGQRYCIGGDNETANIDLVNKIISVMGLEGDYIEYVKDRPGHDVRYATDISKIKNELGWQPTTSLEDGLKITIDRIKNENRI
jgi:dTDP-glucose 4,6-dehydratase